MSEEAKRVGKAVLMKAVEEKLEAEGVKVSAQNLSKAINATFDAIADLMIAEGKINVAGFGTFVTVRTKPKTGRNPQSGAPVEVPAKTRPKFRPAIQLQARVASEVK